MTEDEWHTESDPTRHIEFVEARLGPRRARLLAVAFCRAAGGLFADAALGAAVETAERYADGRASRDELERARQSARETAVKADEMFGRSATDRPPEATTFYLLREAAWAAAFTATSPVPVAEIGSRAASALAWSVSGGVNPFVRAGTREYREALEAQSAVSRALVWDVAGNPFRPVVFDPSWRTGTAVALARQVYESREFSAMPILADALQDAGCDAEQVLTHCRGDGTHARGCWVIDGVLNPA